MLAYNAQLRMEQLKNSVISCKSCGLYKKRNNVVFGEGPTNALIMLIGEGPGQIEDISGRPFVWSFWYIINEHY